MFLKVSSSSHSATSAAANVIKNRHLGPFCCCSSSLSLQSLRGRQPLSSLTLHHYHSSYTYIQRQQQRQQRQQRNNADYLHYKYKSNKLKSQFKFQFKSFSSAATSTSTSTSTTTTNNNNDTSTTTKIQPFLLTDIGEGITEVELLQWYVRPNEPIHQFDKVCEVQSDKATVDITSRYDGLVHSLNGHSVGDMVQVGQPLMYISMDLERGEGEEHVSQYEGESHDSGDSGVSHESSHASSHGDGAHDAIRMTKPETTTFPTPSSLDSRNNNNNNNNNNTTDNHKVLATPAVRKLGKQYNLNLSSIRGSGTNGRVLKEDVLKVLGLINVNGVGVSVSAGAGAGAGVNSMNGTCSITGNITSSDNATGNNSSNNLKEDDDDEQENKNEYENENEDTIIPIRGYHRLMVNSMTTTLQVPHMTYSDEVEMSSLMQCRNDLNQMIQNNTNNKNQNPLQIQKNSSSTTTTTSTTTKLSFLPFMIKACSLSIKEYPILNSSIDVDNMTITHHSRHDIGIAMDSDRGLVVPVIRNCEQLSIMDIAMELNRLRDLAVNGSLSEKDLVNPTFTISNIGSIGGTIMSPVILPPQVAIGAMGKIQRVPRFVSEDSMEVRESHVMNISWGGDHRVIDGATLGRFSNLWKAYIESPMMMAFAMR